MSEIALPRSVSLPDASAPASRQQEPSRLQFANQLRGLAALSVVVSHLVGVYWGGRDLVASATATPVAPGETSHLYAFVSYPWFNFGPFGVAVFFLISGLVVPISLKQHLPSTFLLARLLRIYPTYIVGTALSLSLVMLNAHHWNRDFPADATTVMANLFLVPDFFARPDLTTVSWTLSVELKFYIIMVLFSQAILEGNVAVLFVFGLFTLVLNASLTTPFFASSITLSPVLANMFSFETTYIVFMIFGVLFNYLLRRKISTCKFLLSSAGMALIFILCWKIGLNAPQYPTVIANYGYAWVMFGTLFTVRNYLPRFRILDHLAAISYPLYLVHALVGYSLIKWLTLEAGLSYPVSLACAFISVITLAIVLHITVESWTIKAGKRLSRHKSN